MRIYVTAEHIKKGMPLDGDHCPVALAIKEHTARNVRVTEDEIKVSRKKMPSPKSVLEFVYDYDEGSPVKPFYFNLPNQMLATPSKRV